MPRSSSSCSAPFSLMGRSSTGAAAVFCSDMIYSIGEVRRMGELRIAIACQVEELRRTPRLYVNQATSASDRLSPQSGVLVRV